MTGAPGAAGSVHPPPHPRTIDQIRAEALAHAAETAGKAKQHVFDPYRHPNPELDKYLAFLPWVAPAYHRYKKNPESEKARRILFHRAHPFKTVAAWRDGRIGYRNENFVSILRKIKLKAEAGTRERMGTSTNRGKLVVLWYLYHAVALSKFVAFGGWWYPVNALVRRTAFNLGIGVARIDIPSGEKPRILGRERGLSIPVGLRFTGTTLIGQVKAGNERSREFADEFYLRSRLPKKNYGLRSRARRAWTSSSQFRKKYTVAGHTTPDPAAVTAGAPGPAPAPAPAPEEAPTVDLGVTQHGPAAGPPTVVQPARATADPARPRTPPAPARAATTPVPAQPRAASTPAAPRGPLAAAHDDWQHLSPRMREAIGKEVTALREARRQSPDATREFADTNPLFTRAYGMVLQQIKDLGPGADPEKARQMAQNILGIEGIGGHRQSTLLERDGPTLNRLNSLYQIATAPKGTKLGVMQDLAGATLNGRPTPAQMGVTFNQVRAAVATQLRSGGGLAL